MLRPLTTSLPRLLLLHQRVPTRILTPLTTRTLSTTPPQRRDPPGIIPPTLKQTAKALDHAASTAALAGIHAGEKVAQAARSAVNTIKPSSTSTSTTKAREPIASDMYSEQDLTSDTQSTQSTMDAGRGATTSTGASAKTTAREAEGRVQDVVSDASSRAKEGMQAAKGAAEKFTSEAKGKGEEVAGEVKGKASEALGEAKGKKEEVRGRMRGRAGL